MSTFQIAFVLAAAALALFVALVERSHRAFDRDMAARRAEGDAQYRRLLAELALAGARPYAPILVGYWLGTPDKDLRADVRRAWEELRA